MADTTLKLILLGEDRSAGSSLDKVGKVAGLAFAAAGAAAIAFGKDSLDAFAEADAEQKKLEDAYRRFPGLADGNIDSLRELNEAIQRKVGADADDIAGAQAVLAQYELNEDQLRQMTPLLVDYATKTGQDMPGAAKNLGKALMGNTRAMKDLGIDFKVTGDRGADFAAIVGHLEEKVGGYAESIPEAERNQKILAASFGDLQESLGEELQPIMIEAMRGLQNLTDAAQDADSVFAPLTDITLGLATAIADLTGALGEGGDLEWLSKLKEFADYASGITGLADAARWYTQRSKEAATATEGTADAMRDLRGGARDAAGSVGDLTDETDEGTDAAQEYADAQKAAADALTEVYRNQLALRGDTRALEAAYDDAAAAVKKNGRTLDENTDAGRRNQAALDNIATTALTVKDGMEKAGKSTSEVDRQMDKARAEFIKTAKQMGMSADEAKELADKLGLIKSKKVTVGVILKVGGDKGVKTTYTAGGGMKFNAYDKGGRPKVGELALFHADELWVPDTAGTVLTKRQTANLIGSGPSPIASAGVGGGTVSYYDVRFDLHGVIDGPAAVRALEPHFVGLMRERNVRPATGKGLSFL
jgi:hypothetical protein